jgi:hypothetical protein
MKTTKIKISEMTQDEKIALADSLIERDAGFWKKAIRESDGTLYDFVSRRDDRVILFPRAR